MANKVFSTNGEGVNDYKSHIMRYDDAMKMVKAFSDKPVQRLTFDALLGKGRLFNKVLWRKEAILELLSGDDVAGLGAYLGHSKGRDTIILVALDAKGRDIPRIAVNAGQLCPPHCVTDPDD